MQSYSYSRTNIRTSRTMTSDGVTHSSSDVTAFGAILSVSNGNVQGNKVTPNPITFSKLRYYGHPEVLIHQGVVYGAPFTQEFNTARYFSGPTDLNPVYPARWGAVGDQALEKVYDKIRGNSNFAVDLAESAQTLRMLKATLNLRRVASDFFSNLVLPRKKGLSGGQARLDYITGKWLEYRYGWQPLVHSIYDAMDNLSRQVIALDPWIKGRSTVAFTEPSKSGTGSFTDPRIFRTVDYSYRTEYAIQFRLRSGLQIWDWTSLNPLAIAWELTPLSFVADWVLNVSQQLSLLENYWLYASAFKSGYRTNTSREILIHQVQGSSRYPVSYWPNGSARDGTYWSYTKSGYTRHLAYKDRAVLLGLPLPSGLRLNVKIGSMRQLDAAALLHSLFAKKLRS